jgi:uncharacterized protein YggE
LRRFFPILTLAAAVIAAAAFAAGAGAAAAAREITVSGSGIATTVPDEAQFSFGVTVTGPTAKAALTADARKMNALIAAVKAEGIPAAAIQTSQVSLTPNTNEAGTKIVSFTASNSITVTTKEIAKAGAIVDAAVGAGANLVSGPSLRHSDQQALHQSALTAAVADARSRAQAIAAASHVRLGAVLMVIESSSTPIAFDQTAKAAALPSTPVEPGTVQVEEDVTVTFAIR